MQNARASEESRSPDLLKHEHASFPIRRLAILCFLMIVAAVSVLSASQRKLIYRPHGYDLQRLLLPKSVQWLEFSTSQGKQVSFYLPPQQAANKVPEKIWIIFNGNGTAALDWLSFLREPVDRTSGFLLIDYPGYGISQGEPSRESIRETVDEAYLQLLKHLKVEEKDVDGRVGIFCHSLGCAVGLEFATRHQVDRAILLAPFTTLENMAKALVGWPLSTAVVDKFDNRARLSELSKREKPPEIYIYHGTLDQTVPVRMGRQLGHEFKRTVSFTEMPNADHITIIEAAKALYFEVMRKPLKSIK